MGLLHRNWEATETYFPSEVKDLETLVSHRSAKRRIIVKIWKKGMSAPFVVVNSCFGQTALLANVFLAVRNSGMGVYLPVI
jgi:hypothetical protein